MESSNVKRKSVREKVAPIYKKRVFSRLNKEDNKIGRVTSAIKTERLRNPKILKSRTVRTWEWMKKNKSKILGTILLVSALVTLILIFSGVTFGAGGVLIGTAAASLAVSGAGIPLVQSVFKKKKDTKSFEKEQLDMQREAFILKKTYRKEKLEILRKTQKEQSLANENARRRKNLHRANKLEVLRKAKAKKLKMAKENRREERNYRREKLELLKESIAETKVYQEERLQVDKELLETNRALLEKQNKILEELLKKTSE